MFAVVVIALIYYRTIKLYKTYAMKYVDKNQYVYLFFRLLPIVFI